MIRFHDSTSGLFQDVIYALLKYPFHCMKDNIRFETRDKHLHINYNF